MPEAAKDSEEATFKKFQRCAKGKLPPRACRARFSIKFSALFLEKKGGRFPPAALYLYTKRAA